MRKDKWWWYHDDGAFDGLAWRLSGSHLQHVAAKERAKAYRHMCIVQCEQVKFIPFSSTFWGSAFRTLLPEAYGSVLVVIVYIYISTRRLWHPHE